MLRIVFMGSDAIARPALDWLAADAGRGCQVVAVFTQPDRAAGRGQKVQPNGIKGWAGARGIPVHQPERFDDAAQALLAGLQPDLALVMAYGHILRPAAIATPRLGTLNLHTSILPQYRGASPIQTATASGDAETGVTLMRIVPELDAGPVADVETVAIEALDTAAEVEAKLGRACVPLLARCLPSIAAGTQVFIEQDHARATFCRKLEKADGVLDFLQPAAVLAARINGLMPWPGCAVEINGQPVKLGLADTLGELPAGSSRQPPAGRMAGTVLGADGEGLLVGTGQGVLRLRRLQRSGGRMLPASEFLRGWPVPPDTRLPSQPMPPLVAAAPFPRRKV